MCLCESCFDFFYFAFPGAALLLFVGRPGGAAGPAESHLLCPPDESCVWADGQKQHTCSRCLKNLEKKVWVFCENKLGCNRIMDLYCSVLFVCFFPDHSGARIPVPLSEGSCGVRLGREKNHSVSFFSRYDSCYAHIEVQA